LEFAMTRLQNGQAFSAFDLPGVGGGTIRGPQSLPSFRSGLRAQKPGNVLKTLRLVALAALLAIATLSVAACSGKTDAPATSGKALGRGG
jgi:hypothetical protein